MEVSFKFIYDCSDRNLSSFISSAMIADRVVLLAGTRVGSGAVMGTGSLGRRNGNYAAGSIWIGNSEFSPFLGMNS